VLVAHGAHVVGAARDLDKARTATRDIPAATGDGPGLELVKLDLASLASVRAAADALVAAGKTFDVVIANAGVMACPQGKTADGFETQFGTNHLGHFLLVNRIASLLKPGSRVISLSSGGHRFSDVVLDDINFERTPYSEFVAYGRSKTANVLFAVELDRRLKDKALRRRSAVELDRRLKDKGIRAAAVHPGAIHTELARHMTPAVTEQLMAAVRARAEQGGQPGLQFKSVPQGAATSVWAAIVADADAIGGRYCEDCHVAQVIDQGGAAADGVSAYALNPDTAKALWAKSEELVGERF
jgi:NAD(P)-dependent dehydrogenase (short-subunit alcohol dehydrogenase family)